MFTGIIEELGTVKKVVQQGKAMKLTIRASEILSDVQLGDSISVNGVCLTVTEFAKNEFSADVMPETFKSTSLSAIKERTKVNLERAMSANGRFGGHFVTGHVDGTGQILKKSASENAVYIQISVPPALSHLLIMKGSIAVDGISLTVFGNEDNTVTVSIIPHTASETVLGFKTVGDIVNLEFDMLAKYLYSFMNSQKQETTPHKEGISEGFLKENGFL
ncbi:riboflavin synthase [Cytobacillus firmus]|uniref:riboflavin synthase n=1 Tax=Cytobacillus firmus TaxID=1399 RepID=UPI00157FF9C3|nr:riboflavin synthase [Cytobacillus firmus]MBG9549793.1 riboflavin synthase subunit alpha [Cytobacillus firmus]MBG9604743.1 riboflavin synthase subunit alpha [Cytobacillus firmus]MBG9653875.1 riboflavin synthase subunit alpha [Cytobacillus firmus]MDD9311384.1 riboflavin synthase [Cytobacillus firmus]MED1908677.1 riboflavin synthase [Cytobacillus firmus]